MKPRSPTAIKGLLQMEFPPQATAANQIDKPRSIAEPEFSKIGEF